ncbi:hypothetical protein LWI28_007346 [Acer negundo]|uniref:Protein FAR1-RELATED SEQUENCE n=1 Tax=Acer negundo TaxID=4023 RepID=A0AAD5IT16_ACENE|nr:hypothetical protein LWI28_007346 [Acer negundo]
MDPHIDLNQELSDCGNNNGCGEEHVNCENNDGRGEEHIDSGNNDGGSLIEEPKILEPCNDMEFESDANAYSYYIQYAIQIGFGASKTQCCQSKVTMEWVEARYACTREGTKQKTNALNPRPCLKSNCQALLYLKRREDGKWFVRNFVKEHYQELSPENAHYFPCHRRITVGVKHNITSLHAVGVKTSEIFTALAKKYKGYENIGFMEKNMRNLFDKERRLAIEPGDANAMLELFTNMHEVDPNFVYAMKLDEEHRLKNVCWVDSKGREDYKIFRDVVSFDTTYITNKYLMPFAPFIGVNNHNQSAILGCALLADETTSSFIWLMETWNRAMGGKSLVAILTDQDQAMKAAIAEVFLDAKHRFCLWHILRKVPEKIGHVLRKHDNFMKVFNYCIYHSWTEEDFERKWHNMVETFELHGEDWIRDLFRDRKYWPPTYMRDTFFAGMSTTSRHVMSVLQSCGVFQIPNHYILKRWSKDAKEGHTTPHVLKEADPKKQRFEDLFEKANKLVEEGSVSDQSYKVANRALEEALKKCTRMNHSLTGVKEPDCASHEFHNVEKENVNSKMLSNVIDPKVSTTKGAPKKRIKSGIENSKRRKW